MASLVSCPLQRQTKCYLWSGGTFLYFFSCWREQFWCGNCVADYRRSLNQVVQSAWGPWGRKSATSCQTAERNNQSSERLRDEEEEEGVVVEVVLGVEEEEAETTWWGGGGGKETVPLQHQVILRQEHLWKPGESSWTRCNPAMRVSGAWAKATSELITTDV